MIKIIHHLFPSSDSSSNFIIIFFVDFCTAFDLFDQHMLLQKLLQLDIPKYLVVWYLDFINYYTQFVEIGESVSVIHKMDAGKPQGTLSGPGDFKLPINNLIFDI